MPDRRILKRYIVVLVIAVASCSGWATRAAAVDAVEFKQGDKTMALDGRMLLTAQDGGWLLQGRDGVLWAVPPDKQVKRTTTEAAFAPLSTEQYSAAFLRTLPKGFEVYQTTHYLIFYDTSKPYAQWCGALFERLYMAFNNYWTRKGVKLHEPEFPLVAVIFADRNAYISYSRPTLGDSAEAMIGYYHLMTNRMTMYDLTGREAQRGPGRVNSTAAVNQILAQPGAQGNVATIVHEATHQIAFNCGLHERLSDSPLWFCEGVAMFFETPDLSSAKGWRGVGAVNRPRVDQLKTYLPRRKADSLKTLIADDKRFRDTKQAIDAYAEAWALTYFLINQYPKQYLTYVDAIAKKKPLLEDTPEERVKLFEQQFGELSKIDREFLRYAGRL